MEIQKGIVKQNDFELIYGVPGIGKTTLASERPGAIFMDIEGGSNFLDVSRLPAVKSFKEVLAQIKELESLKFECLVIDSLDHMEPLINSEACEENGWKSIEDGAFGKGYAAAYAKWVELFAQLKSLRKKMHILLIAHSVVKKVNDPMKQQEWDRHDTKLRDKIGGLAKESVDAILFCTYEINLAETKSGKIKSIGDGTRVILTQARPSHEAKNRYGLPYRLPLSYEEYKKARETHQPDSPENLKARIKEQLADIKDPEIGGKAQEALTKAGNDAIALSKILNRLQVLLKV